MTRYLPPRFCVVLPDDAMAPKAHAGEVVEFDRTLAPRAGDGVLVRDREGTFYVRQYRVRRAGEWTAHATNPAYEALEAERDGLHVVGVLIATLSRWS